jgi:hypothetical protein
MAKFDVALCTDNAAFAEYTGAEVARILRALADEVEGQLAEGRSQIIRLRDRNGNRVGFASYIGDDKE